MPMMYTERGFLKAVSKGQLDLVEKYLWRPGQWLKLTDQQANTALHLAIDNGKTEVALRLINAGAPLEERNRHEWTPLYIAALRGNSRVIEALIKAGADINAKTAKEPALHAAIYSRRTSTVEQLLAAGADPKIGHLVSTALRYSQGDIALKLIDAGAELSAPDQYGATPLSVATQNGESRVVALLLEKNVEVNGRDNSGYTALHYCATKNQPLIAEMLLAQGANAELKTNNGETAFRLARDHRNDAVQELLKEKKKRVESAAPGAESWTVLGEARIAYVGHFPAVERKITEIFNFEARERVTITENLRTGAEHVSAPAGFDTLGEATLRRALAEFNTRGGKADEDSVLQNFGATARSFKPAAQMR